MNNDPIIQTPWENLKKKKKEEDIGPEWGQCNATAELSVFSDAQCCLHTSSQCCETFFFSFYVDAVGDAKLLQRCCWLANLWIESSSYGAVKGAVWTQMSSNKPRINERRSCLIARGKEYLVKTAIGWRRRKKTGRQVHGGQPQVGKYRKPRPIWWFNESFLPK